MEEFDQNPQHNQVRLCCNAQCGCLDTDHSGEATCTCTCTCSQFVTGHGSMLTPVFGHLLVETLINFNAVYCVVKFRTTLHGANMPWSHKHYSV